LITQSRLAGSKANQTKVQRVMNRRISDHVGYWTQKKTELEAFALDHMDAPKCFLEPFLTV
jgi:hypothetical protein